MFSEWLYLVFCFSYLFWFDCLIWSCIVLYLLFLFPFILNIFSLFCYTIAPIAELTCCQTLFIVPCLNLHITITTTHTHRELTFGSGQQPHSPVTSWQQLVRSGHRFPASHCTELEPAWSLLVVVVAASLVYDGITSSPLVQCVPPSSHL